MASPAIVALLGETLLSSEGTVPTSSIDADVIGIYFSAHWCPPCRGFTPVLSEAYRTITGSGKKFELVFASSDRDQASFDEYFGEMPFKAIPFTDRAQKEKLSKKYKVSGIPSLILLDREGRTLHKDGRTVIMEDRTGANFPWSVRSFSDIIGTKLLNGDGEEVSASATLQNKVVGVYFSAHWCPPCRRFTPELVKTYKKLKDEGRNFEIVFVSSDKNKDSFQEYFDEMPWCALPFEERSRKDELSRLYSVEGIPTLVLLAADGSIITTNGVAAVSADARGAKFPWLPEPVQDLASSPEELNSETVVIALMERADSGTQAAVVSAMTGVAVEHAALRKSTDGGEGFLFYTATSESGISQQIRGLTKVGQPTTGVQLIILDIPDNGGFYVSSHTGVPTEADIRSFVAARVADTLSRQQLE